MSELLLKCEVCSALLDEEDLFCHNCGTEAPQIESAQVETQNTHSFSCNGCGASMNYDAKQQALGCPFCGSTKLSENGSNKELRARYAIECTINQQLANDAFKKWIGRDQFFRPKDLAQLAHLNEARLVYVPYWLFSAKTSTYWTADSSDVPWGASGNWRPVSGSHSDEYHGILIGASSTLTPNETNSLCPFDLSEARGFDEFKFENCVVEQFRVQKKYARPLARNSIEANERKKCERYVPGRSRNVKVNVKLESLTGHPILLPIWIMNYQYKGEVFRFLLNGQTGSKYGYAPFTYARLFKVLGIIALILLVILLIVAAIGGLASLTG